MFRIGDIVELKYNTSRTADVTSDMYECPIGSIAQVTAVSPSGADICVHFFNAYVQWRHNYSDYIWGADMFSLCDEHHQILDDEDKSYEEGQLW